MGSKITAANREQQKTMLFCRGTWLKSKHSSGIGPEIFNNLSSPLSNFPILPLKVFVKSLFLVINIEGTVWHNRGMLLMDVFPYLSRTFSFPLLTPDYRTDNGKILAKFLENKHFSSLTYNCNI
jgi:hypothetical protein